MASIQDAQSAQQSTDAGWRYWIIALAVIGVSVLAAAVAFFARNQARREDIGKL